MITSTTKPRWIIRKSLFPFSANPGQILGTALADTKSAAHRLAKEVFGGNPLVDRETDPAAIDPFPYRNPLKDQASELVHAPTAKRVMTAMEVQLARALGCARINGPAKGTVRRLHAESHKPTPEISNELGAKLRQIAHQHRGQLPTELLESAGDLTAPIGGAP